MSNLSGDLWMEAKTDANGRTVLAGQRFRAPFHLSKPYWDGITLAVQVVNPTAGILAGDRLESRIDVASNASLMVITPTASRIFQMNEGEARSTQEFTVASAGWLEFMPEPLVPHAGSRYRQSTKVNLAPGAELLFGDLLMPGRLARGEAWAWDRLCLELEVRVDGELIVRERFDQTGGQLKALAGLAGFSLGACFLNLVVVSQRLDGDTSWRRQIMDMQDQGWWIGVSPLRGGVGGWSIKAIAADSLGIRKTLKEIRRVLSAQLPGLASDPRKL